MKLKILIVLLMPFIFLNSTGYVFAKDKSADEFYSSLSENEQIFKEYKNATLNVRKKVNGSDLEVVQKDLGEYSFHTLPAGYKGQDLYFFASIYEDKHMIVKKYALYDLKGEFLEGEFGRSAKREAIENGEFNGWKKNDIMGDAEFSDDNPTD
ncbi:hypothetical protein JFL43_20090 [Viridibacillus sp. YIM B01967]|uniref:Uncharacterized protein n=1 Tax=Viridibacillus soli TaxID=2798301 RepID=A0ABS1HCB8_9BACL|nr:hypothetical protein [Viridibacillus soli]MBK3497090.1 hypothetical protein [Viridibacillus soli]